MNMAEFNRMDVNSMRNDAVRRTREMHKRANTNNSKSNVQAGQNRREPHPEPEQKHENKQQEKSKQKANNNGNPLNSIFSELFTDGKVDNEKILLIALIVILAKEGADMKLLLALGYILM